MKATTQEQLDMMLERRRRERNEIVKSVRPGTREEISEIIFRKYLVDNENFEQAKLENDTEVTIGGIFSNQPVILPAGTMGWRCIQDSPSYPPEDDGSVTTIRYTWWGCLVTAYGKFALAETCTITKI